MNLIKNYLFFILFIKNLNEILLDSVPIMQCLIHNFEYKYEYLYGSDDESSESNVFTYPLRKIDDFQKIVWEFIPIKIKNGNRSYIGSLYFIKSVKYPDEYFCATNNFKTMSLTRRLVKRIKLNQTQLVSNFKCYWNIEELDLKNHTRVNHAYIIKNIYFQKPLYAASFFFNIGYHERSVYLWFNKINIYLNKYKWLIDCSQGDFIYSK